MGFQVVWQELIYDEFNNLKKVIDKQLFEIQATSFERARDIAEDRANKIVVAEEQLGQSKGLHIAKVITLIDKSGVRHKLKER